MQDGHQGHVEHLDSSLAGYHRVTGLQLPTLRRVVVPSLPAIGLFFPEDRGITILPHPSRPFSDTADRTSNLTSQIYCEVFILYIFRAKDIYIYIYTQIRYVSPTNPKSEICS